MERYAEGEKRQNYRAALIAATIINVAPGRKKVVKPEDFFQEQRYTPIDAEDLKQTLAWIARQKNAAV